MTDGNAFSLGTCEHFWCDAGRLRPFRQRQLGFLVGSSVEFADNVRSRRHRGCPAGRQCTACVLDPADSNMKGHQSFMQIFAGGWPISDIQTSVPDRVRIAAWCRGQADAATENDA